MEKKDLLLYELPTISEFVSVGWIQEVFAMYTAWKVNRKWKRYLYRKDREEWVERYLKH